MVYILSLAWPLALCRYSWCWSWYPGSGCSEGSTSSHTPASSIWLSSFCPQCSPSDSTHTVLKEQLNMKKRIKINYLKYFKRTSWYLASFVTQGSPLQKRLIIIQAIIKWHSERLLWTWPSTQKSSNSTKQPSNYVRLQKNHLFRSKSKNSHILII